MIIQALPRGQHDKYRSQIERQILELEHRIVPGLAKATEQLLREQVLALENKLKPLDDKRNPAYYRRKRKTPPAAPVYHFNNDDWIAAKYGARMRSACVCEICAAAPADTYRIHTLAPGERITRHNVEFVCAHCAEEVPREKYF